MSDPCAAPDEALLPLDAALSRLLVDMSPVARCERIPLTTALNRILAENILAPIDLPPWRHAAMDGYAVASARFAEPGEQRTPLAGTSWAGRPQETPMDPATTTRIFTGALVPPNADAVVPQEAVRTDGASVWICGPVEQNAFVRTAGADLTRGALALAEGHRLDAPAIGLLAALGIHEVAVRGRVRVSLFATGDELRPARVTLTPGEIHDSNRALLRALLTEMGAETRDLGRIPDTLAAARAALEEAARDSDAILAVGGASVGDADFLPRALGEIGQIRFWRLAIKPGKPFLSGRIGRACVFGLPGNPVSAWLTFRLLVRPALEKLGGATPRHPLRITALSRTDIRRQPGRQEFLRAQLERDATGQLWVRAATGQDSHRLKQLSEANALLALPADCAAVAAGDVVEVEPLGEFWI